MSGSNPSHGSHGQAGHPSQGGRSASARGGNNKYISSRVLVLKRMDGTTLAEHQIQKPYSDGSTELIRMNSSTAYQNDEGFKDQLYIINKIRESQTKKKYNFTKDDGPVIRRVCQKAASIFEREPRAVEVASPAYVFGDIHGQLRDLLWFEHAFWPRAPQATTARYLFLGDYVDRGAYGLHVAMYLVCMKIWSPKTFFMLRGNHETRDVQMMFTFKKECIENFGESEGLAVWEAVNQVFDRMPLCGYIDDKIYCAHGGIPASTVDKREILRIPCPLKNPIDESPIAWEIMWNDPLDDAQFRQIRDAGPPERVIPRNTHINPDCFLNNTRRGTGYFWSRQGTKLFLDAHQPEPLSTVIRAHETTKTGFAFAHGGRTITIFSASDYCGRENNAAVILVNGNSIKALQIQ